MADRINIPYHDQDTAVQILADAGLVRVWWANTFGEQAGLYTVVTGAFRAEYAISVEGTPHLLFNEMTIGGSGDRLRSIPLVLIAKVERL